MNELPFKVLIDGECPLCKREANLLRRLDKGRGRLVLEDISAPGFDASAYGTTFEAVMGHIHGVLPGGRLIVGMEVFRRAYAAVGLGWLLAPTAWPGLRQLSDAVYNVFAKVRPSLKRGGSCQSGRCSPVKPAGR